MESSSGKGPRRTRPRKYGKFFEHDNPLEAFSEIAPNHYRSAVRLIHEGEKISNSESKNFRFSFYVHSAICLFHACLECYINTELALSHMLRRNKPNERFDAQCLVLQDQTLSKSKIINFLEAYGIKENFDVEIIEDVASLCGLRDRLYHYSPVIKPINEYPEPVIDAFKKAGVTAINSTWTTLASHLQVGVWAKTVTERFVQAHCDAVSRPSPFSGDPAFSWTHDPHLGSVS